MFQIQDRNQDELGASEASRKGIAKNWLVQNRLWVFAIRTPCRPYGFAILHLGVAVAGSLNAHQSPCYSDSLADVPTKNENVVFVYGMPDLIYNIILLGLPVLICIYGVMSFSMVTKRLITS